MKNSYFLLLIISFLFTIGCKEKSETTQASSDTNASATESVGQSGVKDDTSHPNIVQTAVATKDLSTLVKAVQAADLVDALSNAGPFTVFAPTNAAFDKLPAGTLDGLLKPDKKEDLKDILSYHTYVGVLKTDYMQDGQEFDMVNGKKVKITKKDGKTYVNGSEITASVETSNGIVHVINDVLLPK